MAYKLLTSPNELPIAILVIGLVIVELLVVDILRYDKYGSYGLGYRLDYDQYGGPGMMGTISGYGYCLRCGDPYNGFNYTYYPEGEINYSRYGPSIVGPGMMGQFGYWYRPFYSSNYSNTPLQNLIFETPLKSF